MRVVVGTGVNDGREKLLSLVIVLAPNGMVQQDRTLRAANGAVIAAWRDLDGTGLGCQHHIPAHLGPSAKNKLEHSAALYDPVVVGLVCMDVEVGYAVS